MIKNSIVILISISMFIGMFGIGNVVAEQSELPEIMSIYEIYNVYDLQNMSNDLDGNYILMNDIDANITYTWEDIPNNSYGFIPIGTDFMSGEPFTGTLNGNNYTISNLYINNSNTEKHTGLFSYTNDAFIENVVLDNIEIISKITIDFCGGLIGNAFCSASNNVVVNCHINTGVVENIIIGDSMVGGLVGFFTNGKISNCSTNVNVYANGQFTGGLVGNMAGEFERSIYNCSSSGIVTGLNYWCGGLVGMQSGRGDAYITKSYSTCNVYGEVYVGGLIGLITGQGTVIVSECYSTGNVIGNNQVGGFVGNITGGNSNHIIQNCYATGNIIRPVVGIPPTTIDIGGFVGSNNNNLIINCYSTGNIIYEGLLPPIDSGFSGRTYDLGQLVTENCHWDMNTSNQISSSCDAEGNTTVEMMQQATFIGWDFENVWYINENETYPYLQWQGLIIEESEEQADEIGFADIIILLLISIMPVIIIVAIFKNIFGSIGKTMFNDGKKK